MLDGALELLDGPDGVLDGALDGELEPEVKGHHVV